MQHHLRTLATLAVACAGFGAAPAFAQAGPTVSACVGKQTGVMRFTDAATGCRSGESLVTWGVQGPQGPQGETGPQGPAGPQTFMSAVVLANGLIQVLNKPLGSTFTVIRAAAGAYKIAVTGLGNTCPLPTANAFSPVAIYFGNGGCANGNLDMMIYTANGQDASFAIGITGLQLATNAAARSQAIKVLGD